MTHFYSETPLVSVIMPTAGSSRFIQAATASVLSQDYPRWELCIVDNGSQQQLENILPADVRISLISEKTPGTSFARNAGIGHTAGKLLAFLDDDDLWEPSYLAKQVASLETTGVAGSVSRFDLIDADQNRTGEGWVDRPPTYRSLCRGDGIGILSNVVVHRDAVLQAGLFDTGFGRGQDFDLIFRVIRHHEFALVDEVLCHYRQHRDNATKDYRGCYRGVSRTLRRAAHFEDDGRFAEERVADLKAGLRRVRANYSAQALQAMRHELHASGRGPLPTAVAAARHLSWSLCLDPRGCGHALLQAADRRIRPK